MALYQLPIRRTQSENHLHMCLCGKETTTARVTTHESNNHQPSTSRRRSYSSCWELSLTHNLPSSVVVAHVTQQLPVMMSKNQCKLSDAIDDWHALVEREQSPSYKQHAISNSRSYLHFRELTCTTFYAMVDNLYINRRVVSIGLFYFERYHYLLSRIEDETDKYYHDKLMMQFRSQTDYKWLVVLTCMCLAMKLHADVSEESLEKALIGLRFKNGFSFREVVRTELKILDVLKYHLYPPVPRYLLEAAEPLLHEIGKDEYAEHCIREVIQYSHRLLECSVFYREAANELPSSLAFASVIASMNYLCAPKSVIKKWESLNLKQSSRARKCVPLLQDILFEYEEDGARPACASPRTVGDC